MLHLPLLAQEFTLKSDEPHRGAHHIRSPMCRQQHYARRMARVASALILLCFALCLVEKTESKDLQLEDVLTWMDKLQEMQVRMIQLDSVLFIIQSDCAVICHAAVLASSSHA